MSSGGGARILRGVLARSLLLALSLPLAALAQEPASLGVSPGTMVEIPALTPVLVRIDEAISSNKNKPGDRFRISVPEDVRVDGIVVIPAGSAGEGEVIHAAKSGAGGKAGELILAARYVRVGEVVVRLRSFTLGVVGKDHSADALATSLIAGPFAMFVHGGVVIVPPDTRGLARTASPSQLPAAAASMPPPSPSASVEPKRE
jgi:hypothetical protein